MSIRNSNILVQSKRSKYCNCWYDKRTDCHVGFEKCAVRIAFKEEKQKII